MVPGQDDAHSTSRTLTQELKAAASRLGFALSGACPAVAPTGYARFLEWLAAGYSGEMRYLAERAECYQHPRSVLDGVRSLLLLALPYRTVEPAPAEPGTGRISRYAWGTRDYHDVIHERLRELCDVLRQLRPAARVRGVVDSAPLLEREFAQLAGLGWVGKHTLLLNRQWGSWFFLAALLTDQELDYDAPFEADHCGSCRACLDACPTQAFPQPYVLDATRCISYLTIEHRGPWDQALSEQVSDWLFGCDVCQEVCPWNQRAPLSSEVAFQPALERNPVKLAELFALQDDDFRRLFRQTPLWRAKRRGVLRNAAILLGNQRDPAAVPALTSALHDCEPLVRSAAASALQRITATN